MKIRWLNFTNVLNSIVLTLSSIKILCLALWELLKQRVFGSHKSKIWQGAQNIIQGIKTKRLSSKYSHSNKVDASLGSYEVDCSGFVNHILITEGLIAPLLEVQNFLDSREDLPKPKNLDPWPIHYVPFFETPRKNWHPVRVLELKPGDVIAYSSYRKELLSSEHGQHMMVVDAPIKYDKESSCVWVPIFDSTKIPHGASDIRENSNGIGQGTIGIVLDENGNPTRIQWSPESKYKFRRRIAMARVID